MYNSTEKLLTKIDNAKDKIRELFFTQCKHGKQTTSLNNQAVAACGQFLDVMEKPQRGLHGTAAAIRVLGQETKQETAALVPMMVEYIKQRDVYEPNDQIKCKSDNNNVVKISEAFIALKYLKEADTTVVVQFAKRLRAGFKREQGWSWFLDDQGDVEPFPTAFACYALSFDGYHAEVNKAHQYLIEYLKQNDPKNGSRKRYADTMTDVLCLYVLTEVTSGRTTSEERKLFKNTFDRIWHRLEPLLSEDLEQNVGYWDVPRGNTCYVRIPWQLYLLALASKYRFIRRFSSWVAQVKLNKILEMVNDQGGYAYPYSGKHMSSRTYAILYETLEIIHRNIEHRKLLPLFLLFDCAVRLLRNKYARLLVFVIGTIFLAYVGYRWYQNTAPTDYPNIFNNLIAVWLFTIISWSQRSR